MKSSMSTLKVLVVLFGIFIVTACEQRDGDYSEQVLMVPAGAALVMDIDLESLSSKISSEQFQNSSFSEILSEKLDDQLCLLICEDSIKTGIDYTELLAFVLSEKQYGVALKLDDATAFEFMLTKTLAEEGVSVNVQVNEGYKTCVFGESKLLLIWNETKALCMSDTELSIGLTLFKQNASESIVANKDFRRFYSDEKELAVWMDMESYMAFAKDIPMLKQGMGLPIFSEYEELYEGMHSSYNMEFLNGEVVVIGKMTPLNKAKELSSMIYKESQSKELLSAVPGESLLLLSASLNFSGFVDMYKSLPQLEEIMKKPETQNIINSIDGDVVLSISDFASGPLPIPNVVIGLSVNDSSVMKSILEIGSIQKVQKEGYDVLLVKMFQIFVAQKNDFLLVSTDEEVIESFVSGNALKENLSNSKHRRSAELSAYSYINLNLDTYPAVITGLLQGKVGKDFTTLNEAMCFEDITSTYDYETCESKTVLKLKDEERNSLSALFEMVDVFMSLK